MLDPVESYPHCQTKVCRNVALFLDFIRLSWDTYVIDKNTNLASSECLEIERILLIYFPVCENLILTFLYHFAYWPSVLSYRVVLVP